MFEPDDFAYDFEPCESDADTFEADCVARDHEGDDPEWGVLVEDGYLDQLVEDQIGGTAADLELVDVDL